MKRFWLTLRIWLATALLFAVLYAIIAVICTFLGFGTPLIFAIMSIVVVFAQYMLGPSMVERVMHVRYVSPQEAPNLHAMIDELAMNAGIPKPKVGVAETTIPNAFAFGRTKKDGRVCVTRGILNILDEEELKAVLGHEISHIRHNDMAVMTLISVVPLICYWIFISTLFGDSDSDAGVIGIVALVGYLLGQLLVLFVSRVREYYADQGSVEIGGKPHKLASALYKLVYGSVNLDKRQVKEVEGVKAFFVNDISDAHNEISDLEQLDLDMDGSISEMELAELRNMKTSIGTGSKIMELLSTHPNMVKRVKRLAELSNT
ncbi:MULTISPECIES: zinc metalloprotease HtpX [Methanobacterium]|uniref:Protease HtpX homolog n=2 Tax=Methanobacterium formicicum TaxID=2162 RepID=A0A090I1S2_METFO|nr:MULTISPECIES: zinc metalloprotease HtpX [Methanobacterium]AIS31399.1 peptidase M48 family [Methanobacterium formicicum]KUK73022.1 MAG: Protease HtpX-like protein [Methanobacterium sp. 42_16]MBF4475637.1 M48 family metalloprotease [Methanobacterium formicicum]MDG3547755.1 zinc metalloprotease HtpX [Methanobacterium formicicum]MDH2658833.1 zinc metalloprotease HtpX [Methanobacterium formicicum]